MPDNQRETNPRGHARVKLGEKDYTLRLTVGAAMDIEEHFDCSLDEIEKKLQKVHMKDLFALVQILTRGGGDEIPEDELRDVSLTDLEPAILAAFEASGDDTAKTDGKKGKKSGGKKRWPDAVEAVARNSVRAPALHAIGVLRDGFEGMVRGARRLPGIARQGQAIATTHGRGSRVPG